MLSFYDGKHSRCCLLASAGDASRPGDRLYYTNFYAYLHFLFSGDIDALADVVEGLNGFKRDFDMQLVPEADLELALCAKEAERSTTALGL